jgi:hypothetical protein
VLILSELGPVREARGVILATTLHCYSHKLSRLAAKRMHYALTKQAFSLSNC